MGKISVVIPDELMGEFRRRAHQVFGHSQKSLDMAFEEAVKEWIAGGDKR